MATIFDTIPGVAMPVSEVAPTLSRMWSQVKEEGHKPPSEFRASQMNLILHFGIDTSPEEARQLFEASILFAQRYPCRIVVLCPTKEETDSSTPIHAKLFSQCYIGSTQRQMCCCEAIVLGYPSVESGIPESQISIWLENDLPVYHWLHRVPESKVEQHYLQALKDCTRVLYDSAIEPESYAQLPWPKPDLVRDLAYARLLNVRQGIGQYLSGFNPKDLVDGLTKVEFGHTEDKVAEATHLRRWMLESLESCLQINDQDIKDITVESTALQSSDPYCLSIAWTFSNKRYFKWQYCEKTKIATIAANLGKTSQNFAQRIETLPTEKALAEALFF